jgi:chitodextrinase
MMRRGKQMRDTANVPVHKTARTLLAVALACLCLSGLSADVALAAGGSVIRPAGYDANIVPRGDNTSVGPIALPFPVSTKPSHPTVCYINTNGNITFVAANAAFDPAPTLASLKLDMYAPFWADVDTTNVSGGTISYSSAASPPQVDGHNAFIVTWDGVGYHSGQVDKTNVFQLVLIDRSDISQYSYDIEFNYDQVQWDRATDPVASVGYARSGISHRSPASGDELPGSGISGAQVDGGANALITHSRGTTVLGRYVWQVRNGVDIIPPSITLGFVTKALEGNSATPSPGYAGYSGTVGDASAVPNGAYVTLTSLVRSPVAGSYLPLGGNTITWTATDSDGGTATATQTITVVDTTPPKLPAITSPTHVGGFWSPTSTVRVNWTTSTDACSGLRGYSYVWSQNAAALPDTVVDTATTTYTQTLSDGTWYYNIRASDNAGNWSAATSFGPVKIDMVSPTPPTGLAASALSTSSVVTSWAPSTDALSGVADYGVYRDGVLITTVSSTTYTDTGLTPGQTYTYRIVAYDAAGNASLQSASASVTPPPATIWMNVSTPSVNFGGVTPLQPVTVTGATTVSVNGIGAFAYDLTCAAPDFSNVSTASVTPFMPIGSLSFVTKGYKSVAQQSFTTASLNIDSSTGSSSVWKHDYTFDYIMDAPWTTDPGTYQTTVVYTAVAH